MGFKRSWVQIPPARNSVLPWNTDFQSVRPAEVYSAETPQSPADSMSAGRTGLEPGVSPALALRFFLARGSVRTSCSALELSDCRTSENPRFLTPSPERTKLPPKIIHFA